MPPDVNREPTSQFDGCGGRISGGAVDEPNPRTRARVGSVAYRGGGDAVARWAGTRVRIDRFCSNYAPLRVSPSPAGVQTGFNSGAQRERDVFAESQVYAAERQRGGASDVFAGSLDHGRAFPASPPDGPQNRSWLRRAKITLGEIICCKTGVQSGQRCGPLPPRRRSRSQSARHSERNSLLYVAYAHYVRVRRAGQGECSFAIDDFGRKHHRPGLLFYVWYPTAPWP